MLCFIFFNLRAASSYSFLFKSEPSAKKIKESYKNEVNLSDEELSGSAPFTIEFSSNAKDSVFIEWNIETPHFRKFRRVDENLTYKFDTTGIYNITLMVKDTLEIGEEDDISEEYNFLVKVTESFIDCPNFFSPNSTPGENDEFKVAYKSINSFHGIIINRWGQKMFEWYNPADGWDGKYKGKDVSPGVYFYIIKAVGSDGVKYNKKGDINLL